MQGEDSNSTYFHDCLKKKRDMNHVYRLKNMSGDWVEDLAGIEQAFIKYYENLLDITKEHRTPVSQRIINEEPSLNVDQQKELCASFTSKDVKSALFDIDENKALGLDGYPSGFYRRAWPYIGGDLQQS